MTYLGEMLNINASASGSWQEYALFERHENSPTCGGERGVFVRWLTPPLRFIRQH
jgi:hypothetical protein